MAKLLPNRISETLSDAQIKQFKAGIEMALNALPKKPVVSKDEFDKIPKKGDLRIKEADLKIKVVQKYPKFLPTALTVQDIQNDNVLHGQLNALFKNDLQTLVDDVLFILGLSGGEELNAYGRYTENVKKAKDDNDVEAIAPLDELDAIDKQLGLGSYRTTALSPEEKALKAEQEQAMKAMKAAKKK